MSKLLFFDTETSGFASKKKPVDHPSQPHIVQLAAIMTDENGTEKQSINFMLDVGIDIPYGAAKVHGLNRATLETYGLPPRDVMGIFTRMLDQTDVLIAHNIEFDMKMLYIMLTRHGFHPDKMSAIKQYCTMNESKHIINLPPTPRMLQYNMRGPKVPKLQEAFVHFFGCEFEGAHDALADVRACRDVYFKLQEIKKEG